MADMVRRVGELGDPLVSVLQDENGPIDIHPGSTVTITMTKFGSTPVLNNAAAVVVSPGAAINSPDRGKVMYPELSADVSSDGIYDVTWWLTLPGQLAVPYPSGSPLTLLILPD